MNENVKIANIITSDERNYACLVNMFDGSKYEIDSRNPFVIGREAFKKDTNLYINEDIVSRKHAKIIYKDDVFFIIDLGSKNGTYLNGKKLEPYVIERLRHYDIIEFSKIKYRFEKNIVSEDQLELGYCSLEFIYVYGSRKLCVKLEADRKIIHYQHRMIDTNTCPNLLKMTILDSEQGSRIYYDLNNMQSISHVYRKDIDKSQFVHIMLEVLNIVKQSGNFLLYPGSFVLEPEVIFLNEQGTMFLLYLPIQTEAQYLDNIRELIMKMIENRLEEDKDFWTKIIGIISSFDYDMDELKKMLINAQKPDSINCLEVTDTVSDNGFQHSIQLIQIVMHLKKEPLLLFQGFLVTIMGCILYLDVLDLDKFVGLSIIVLALDAWIVKKYLKIKEPSQ